MGLCSAVVAEGQTIVVPRSILRGLGIVDPLDWDQVAEQLTRTLPEIEPLRIQVSDDTVTLCHADVTFSRRFADAEAANEHAGNLRCELFDDYARLVDDYLTLFARQAMAARNG